MKNAIIEALNNLDNSDLIAIHNEYCDACNDPDSRIYDMCDIDEMLSGYSPSDIAGMIFYGSFNPNDDYFTFDGYANLASFDYVTQSECPICEVDIAEYIVDYDEDFGNDDIREILDAADEDDEDEADEE